MKNSDKYEMREATEEEYMEHMKELAEEKIGIRKLTPEEIEKLKKEGRLKPLYEVWSKSIKFINSQKPQLIHTSLYLCLQTIAFILLYI